MGGGVNENYVGALKRTLRNPTKSYEIPRNLSWNGAANWSDWPSCKS